jgi:hypothetical protein
MGPDLAMGRQVVDNTRPAARSHAACRRKTRCPAGGTGARLLPGHDKGGAGADARDRARPGPAAGHFDAAFDPGVSTLRLLRYPVRPEGSLDGVAPDEGLGDT